jgi:predicted nucleic acid-binding protein
VGRWQPAGARRNEPPNLADALIAGVAWFNGATIVTRNPDDFIAQGVPVLTYD